MSPWQKRAQPMDEPTTNAVGRDKLRLRAFVVQHAAGRCGAQYARYGTFWLGADAPGSCAPASCGVALPTSSSPFIPCPLWYLQKNASTPEGGSVTMTSMMPRAGMSVATPAAVALKLCVVLLSFLIASVSFWPGLPRTKVGEK